MSTRKDSKGRVLHKGEGQRNDYYTYQYTDIHKKRRVIYAKDLPELRAKEHTLLCDIQDGLDVAQRASMTLNDAFDRFYAERTDLKHSSRVNYWYLYDHYVRPGFGRWRLSVLSHSSFRTFYLSLVQESGLSKKTVLLIHSILHQVLKNAVRDNILRTNPAEGVMQELSKKYGWQENKRHALTPEQQMAFLKHAINTAEFEEIVPLLIVLLGTGLRIGEALGLCWEKDIDFSEETICVSRSLQYRKLANGSIGFYISTPKTASGRRSIPMISQVKQALYTQKQHQIQFFEQRKDCQPPVVDDCTGFVFTNPQGGLYHANTVNRIIKRILRSYNAKETLQAQKEDRTAMLLPDISCHHLRHTFCSRLCENETNLKIIQDIMGHASITTTMNRYAEVNSQKKAEKMNALEQKILLL